MNRESSAALLFAMVAIGVVYAGLMAALPPGAFFSGDEGIKWLQIDALWRHKWTTFAIDPPGGAFDPDADFIPPFLVREGGTVRSVFPAGMPLIASLPYALAGSRGIYLVPAIAALLCMGAATRLAGVMMPSGWAVVSGVASVATSPLVFYGATIWEHTLAAALCTAAMIPLAKSAHEEGAAGPLVSGLAAGALIGLAASARTECLLMIPAAVAAGAIAWGPRAFAPRAAGVSVGAGLLLLPQALYHRVLLGTWMPPHLMANLPGGALGRTSRSAWTVAADLLGPSGRKSFLAGAAIVLALLWLIARMLPGRVAQARWSVALIAAGALLAMALIVLGPARTLALELSSEALSTRDRGYQSLLHTMPIVALLPLAMLLPPASRRPQARLVGWSAAIFVCLAVAFAPVEGGLQWGPRLLLPAAPLITLWVISVMAEQRVRAGGRLAITAVLLALGLGLVMQGLGLRFLVAVRKYNAGVLETVRKTVPAGDVILSDFFAVPQLLATLSASTPVLYVTADADVEALSTRLAAANVTPFWIVRQRPSGAGEVIHLGAGLEMVRYEREHGVRGFLRPPPGD